MSIVVRVWLLLFLMFLGICIFFIWLENFDFYGGDIFIRGNSKIFIKFKVVDVVWLFTLS